MARHRRFRGGLGPATRFDVQHEHRQRQAHFLASGDRHLSAAAQADRHVHHRGRDGDGGQAERLLVHAADRSRCQPAAEPAAKRRNAAAGCPGTAAGPDAATQQRPFRHRHRFGPGSLPPPDAQQDECRQGRTHHGHAQDLHPRRHRRFRRYQIPYLQRILEQGDRLGQQSGVQPGKRERGHLQFRAPEAVRPDSPAERDADHRPG